MARPPEYLDGARVLRFCRLDERVRSTGTHKLVVDDVEVTPFAAAICQYERDRNVYLFLCDAQWEVLSDSDWGSVEEALEVIEQWYSGASALLQPSAGPS